ncbi:hypothetical protein D9619_013047 [Psilocybe cf. subviscida]|uniref:GH16 domain-containing protein n=1 Tax=Psilocybe cf. subviscida TaxID=2480587 RepID=A0A8H5EVK8_9AGAR|nr:hypothetical protein D9619_013047 [Psilocybe cf. subviscida]
MKPIAALLAFPVLALATFTYPGGGLYYISEDIVGSAFYTHFNWEAISDPTHGRVNYVDQATSIRRGLTRASFNSFRLGADSRTVLNATGPGRDSVRIISKKAYTNHLAIFDVRHMPQGCGTWPAIWETQGANWPEGGEVDIVEGVNDVGPNAATLHTTEGCTMPATRRMTGTAGQNDCNWLTNFNTGCTVKMDSSLSYGPSFNENGGGWYAMERTPEYISVWFWPRNSITVPIEVRTNTIFPVSTKNWGIPVAFFPNTSCDITKFFGPNNIIINLTFCGDWAGNVYSQTSCPSTCVDYVNNNPGAFKGAYFDFASIRVYEPRN